MFLFQTLQTLLKSKNSIILFLWTKPLRRSVFRKKTHQFECRTHIPSRIKKLRKVFWRGTIPFLGHLGYLFPCTKSILHSTSADSPSYICRFPFLLKTAKKNIWGRPSLSFTDQEAQARDFGEWINPFIGQVLQPSPVQSSRSIQRIDKYNKVKIRSYTHLLYKAQDPFYAFSASTSRQS